MTLPLPSMAQQAKSYLAILIVAAALFHGIAAVAVDEAPEPISFGTCDSPCDPSVEFCGTDNACHIFSCPNIYDFASDAFTGAADMPQAELECTNGPAFADLACDNAFDFGDTVTPWPVAISFFLDPNNNTGDLEFLEAADGLACDGFTNNGLFGGEVIPFDRFCRGPTFECYDFDPDLQTERRSGIHQDFIDEVTAIQDAAGGSNSTSKSYFVYHTRLEPSTRIALGENEQVEGRNIIRTAFNEDLADLQIQSRRLVPPATPVPTISPQPTATPQPSSLAAPSLSEDATSGAASKWQSPTAWAGIWSLRLLAMVAVLVF